MEILWKTWQQCTRRLCGMQLWCARTLYIYKIGVCVCNAIVRGCSGSDFFFLYSTRVSFSDCIYTHFCKHLDVRVENKSTLFKTCFRFICTYICISWCDKYTARHGTENTHTFIYTHARTQTLYLLIYIRNSTTISYTSTQPSRLQSFHVSRLNGEVLLSA